MRLVIALGSNLGESEKTLNLAIEKLKELCKIDKISKFIETEPVGGPVQPNYLNAVIIGSTDLTPEVLLEKCLEIENDLGRVREERWGARTIDIDLISVGNIEMDTPALTLPHPRAHERRFVLEPWFEIDQDAVLIGKGKISQLLAAL